MLRPALAVSFALLLALVCAIGCGRSTPAPAGGSETPAASSPQPANLPAPRVKAEATDVPAAKAVAETPDGSPAVPPAQRKVAPPPRSFAIPERALAGLTQEARSEEAGAELPLSLTASDGTGLSLEKMVVRGVVEAPLAFTELRLTFRNPEPRQREGRFRITLPQGASVSRFAMRIAGRWQEGEVVERQAARRAYEDFLHRRQDPALLEQEAANEFSARVFPIPANATKELILSYSQELVRSDDRYRVPLKGLPSLGELDLRVMLGRAQEGDAPAASLGGRALVHQVVEVKKRGWTPDADFTVEQPRDKSVGDDDLARPVGLRNGNLVVARVAPILEAPESPIDSLFVLVDSSASRALGFERQVALVEQLVTGLADGAGPDTPVGVASFDQVVELIHEGRAADFGAEHRQRMLARGALGASNLDGALAWLAEHVRERGRRYQRVLLVTDGVATAGELEGDRLRASVQALRAAETDRLDVLTVGGIREDALLRRLVTAGLPHDGQVVHAGRGLLEIVRRLERGTVSQVAIEVEGAEWVWPTRLDGAQPGDEVLVYADLPADRPLRLRVGGKPVELPADALASAERPLLERAWVGARLARIEHQRDTIAAADPDLRAALRQQMIQLSTRHRVLSPYTALLVLETEGDYARFGIDRRALADILVVGGGGVDVLRRSTTPLRARGLAQVDTKETDEAEDDADQPGRPLEETTARAEKAAESRERERAQAQTEKVALEQLLRGGEAAGVADGFLGDTGFGGSGGLGFKGTGSGGGGSVGLRRVGGGKVGASSRASTGRATAGGAAGHRVTTVTKSEGKRTKSRERVRLSTNLAQLTDASGTEANEIAAQEEAEAARDENRRSRSASLDPAPPAPTASAPAPVSGPRAATPKPDVTLAPRKTVRPQRRAAPDPFPGVTAREPRPRRRARRARRKARSPHTGVYREVQNLLAIGELDTALRVASDWRTSAPGDVLALVALGDAAAASGDVTRAARAYGSLIDLFPSRADLRRHAGERLESLPEGVGDWLAADTYAKAVEQRPDHPTGHRLLGYALLKLGDAEGAFHAIWRGLRQSYPSGRYRGVRRILQEDLALMAATWRPKDAGVARDVQALMSSLGVKAESKPSLRFVLNWETDANDVDLHVWDKRRNHAYYKKKRLNSGGRLYADVTTGYGPECLTVRRPAQRRAYPYELQAHYYRRGPMGYGMGKLQVVEHDGDGNVRFEEHPFVVMTDKAYVPLATVEGSLF